MAHRLVLTRIRLHEQLIQWHQHLNRGRLVLGRAHAPVAGPLRQFHVQVLETLETLSVFVTFRPRSDLEYVLGILLHYSKVANLRRLKLYTTTQLPAVIGNKLTYDGPTPKKCRRLGQTVLSITVCDCSSGR
jgi:hypothetical protein